MLSEYIPDLIIPFALACLVIELTPGPNMGYLAIVSATTGRQAGLATVAGVALGLLIIGITAALGLSAIIANSKFLYETLRWAGIFYLLWLAWESWHTPIAKLDQQQKNTQILDEKNSKYFLRGLVTNLLNPKAGVFYVAVLPGFVSSANHVTGQLITLSLVYVTIATIIHLTIVMLASSASSLLDSAEKRLLVRRTLSLLLAAIAIWFGWSTRL